MKQLKKPRSLTGAFSFDLTPLFLHFIRVDALTDAVVYLYLIASIGIPQKTLELTNDAS